MNIIKEENISFTPEEQEAIIKTLSIFSQIESETQDIQIEKLARQIQLDIYDFKGNYTVD